MAIGCQKPLKVNKEESSMIECTTIPTEDLDIESMKQWPNGIRNYEITDWELVGIHWLINVPSKASELESLLKSNHTYFGKYTSCKPLGLALWKYDFIPPKSVRSIDLNMGKFLQNLICPIIVSEEIERNMLDNDDYLVPLLSVRIDNMLIGKHYYHFKHYFSHYKAKSWRMVWSL